MDVHRFAALAALTLALVLSVAGCSGKAASVPQPAPVSTVSGPPIAFSFETLSGEPLSTESVAGRVTVIGFITTYDVPSQAQVRFLTSVGRRHTPRINVALLVLEAQENRPLVEAFVAALSITDPVALADAETIAGKGPFTGLHHVPSVVILDKQGHEVWRRLGLVTESELEQAVRSVEGIPAATAPGVWGQSPHR